MSVTTAPSVEACLELVDRINAGSAYVLDMTANYTEQQIDLLEDFAGDVRVDVVTEDEIQLNETLTIEDRTSHTIRVWIRGKIKSMVDEEIQRMKLLTRQIYQQVNDHDSADGRVKVWACDEDSKQNPDKETLKNIGLFVSSVVLRVEVEAS